MELRQYVYLVWRWLWLIVMGALIAGASAYYISRAQAPVYEASATLLVIEGSDGIDNAYNSLLTSEQLAQSYVERLKNYEVLAQAITNLGLTLTPQDLAKLIQVQLVNNTQLIVLRVEHTSPDVARDLANEIPAIFAERNSEQQLARYASLKVGLEDELASLTTELTAAESNLQLELGKTVLNQTAVDRLNDNVLRLRETYARLMANYEDVRIAEVRSLNTLIIDEYARTPEQPIRPRTFTNTILATIVGGMVALGLVFLVEYLDDTLKNPNDIEITTGLNTLGSLQKVKVSKPVDALVVAMEPRSPAAEAYRHIRTNIQYVSVDKEVRTLLITSANIGEGKTTVSINLAAALAQSGKRVLIVDTDMRRPMLHKMLEVDGSKGLCNMIIRGREDAQYIKSTLIPNLYVLPAGRLPPNPAELLGSERMKDLFAWLKEQADYVIFDSPPVLAVTDAVVLSRLVDTTILVASAGQTRYPAFSTAVSQIEALGSPIAGVILNKVNANGRFGYAYNYYYRTNYQPLENSDGRKSLKRRWQTFNTSLLQLFH